MNVKLLRKVQKNLTRHAKRFNMCYWASSINDVDPELVLEKPPCKTQACLAAEIIIAAGLAKVNRKNGGFIFPNDGFVSTELAADQIQVDYYQAKRLFWFKSWANSPYGWPVEFESRYKDAKTAKERVQVAIDRIEHFIKTDGQE